MIIINMSTMRNPANGICLGLVIILLLISLVMEFSTTSRPAIGFGKGFGAREQIAVPWMPVAVLSLANMNDQITSPIGEAPC